MSTLKDVPSSQSMLDVLNTVDVTMQNVSNRWVSVVDLLLPAPEMHKEYVITKHTILFPAQFLDLSAYSTRQSTYRLPCGAKCANGGV